MTTDLGFIHRYIPSKQSTEGSKSLRTLLLLHGTGGNENDLLSLGSQLAPDANLLSPRGKVLENGMPRFFRRFAEGVLDEEDVAFRSNELADFVKNAAEHYQFDAANVIALGYSNGANVAMGMLLLRPTVLTGAVLLRAMLPLTQNPPTPDLSGKRVFLSLGERDPILPKDKAQDLIDHLNKTGVTLDLHWWPVGHGLVQPEFELAQRWLNPS